MINSRYRVLSLDGGGARGIFTASFLHQLEKHVGALQDRFDLVVGTSTGGIIAVGLGKGLNMGEILALYNKEIPNIFERPLSWKIKTGWGILGPKYDNNNLARIIRKYIGNSYIDEAKVRFITTSYNTDNSDVILIDSKDNTHWGFDDAAISTACAPTYFPSYRGMIDGGVYASNPVLIGLIEGIKAGYSLQDIAILNVGTGYSERGYNTSSWGKKQWVFTNGGSPILNVMFDGVSEKDSYIAGKLLGESYIYINPKLERKYPMDTVDRGVLDYLSNLGEDEYRKNGVKVQGLLS